MFQVRLRTFFFLERSCCVVLCPVREHRFTLYHLCSACNNTQVSFTSRNIFNSGWNTQYLAVVVQLLHLNCPIISPFLCYTGKKNPTYITIYIRFWKMGLSSSVLTVLHRSASLHCWMTDSLTSHLCVYAQRCETETRAATNACFYYTLEGNESLGEQKRRLFMFKAPSDGNKLPSLRSVSSFRDFNYLKHYLHL